MEITSEELKQKIENGDKLIVDFWGVWCSPCKVMKPVFEKVAEEYRKENSEVQLYTMDVDKNKEFAASLGIRAIPTVKSFSDGKEVYSQPGMQMESQIKQLVTNLING
jgi:thioredoxin 1